MGDPLARPFGSDVTWEDGVLTIRTSQLDRATSYRIEAADGPEGRWEVALDGIAGGRDYHRQTIVLAGATRGWYRLVEASGGR